MSLLAITSPHMNKSNTRGVGFVMTQVILATVPGILAMTWFFGWGTLINIGFALLVALISEALVLKLRKRPVGFYLKDGSAIVTALLLALAIPPLAPWWLTLVGVAFAIIVAKHMYGGMGFNPFNPAMVAYALLLVSFPVDMTQWVLPETAPSFIGTFQHIFGLGVTFDGMTSATPLDAFKHSSNQTLDELFMNTPALMAETLVAWQTVSICFLIGGVYLLARRIYTWHAPVGMLGSLAVMALIFSLYDADTYAPLTFHLLTGATMLGAFFIITDPVTSATSTKGRFIFGIGVGILVYIIRAFGNYPDAVAFAVLLMNFAAPFIDQYSQPRTYGHRKARKGLPKKKD
ncbi:electron transport complex subunit RsxD [Litoribacillus peritrichatus]|uniref:Ion-translocating oxidoreductase complex subunit D n=1 Tax=Litoribacillus peritrichatus TaxID=718191 RepID=A0ABP7M1U1_9GAMM